jgi:hydrophobe/amphiphile efflux-1 (HAE1) family protein
MSISEPFIRRPIATSLLMAGVLLMGFLGYELLPISALPPVDFPTIQVVSQFPGASPDVMASSVTTPLERQFGQISGLSQMTSISAFGTTTITLQFTLDRNIDSAAQDVQAAINAASGVLPVGMPNPPTFNKVNPADTPILTLQLTSKELPLAKVNDLADTVLAQKLSEVTGVGLVTIEGNQKPAVRVRINPAALASLGLGMEDVRSALMANNVNLPKGSFDGRKQAYSIGANDQIFTAADFGSVIVKVVNGNPVRLKDIGEVVDDVENVHLAGWVNNNPAVIVDIQRQPGANIIQTANRVKALLPRLKSVLPPSIKITVFSDRTEMIRASIKDVQFTLILTVGLVVMVIFLFLRTLWATVITSVALPLAIVGTFGLMYLLGFSLDNLSLMALTISTGFVVDDAIVMIENIVRFIEAGDTPMVAALKGAKQIGFTVVSLSLSLIGVFIPLIFMSGIVGRLFREFAITMSAAVVVSMIVSLTLTPMMCSRLLRPESESHHGKLWQLSERFFQGFLGLYERGLKLVLAHQPLTFLVAVATLFATVWLYVLIPKGLLPLQDTGMIIGVTDASQSISFAAMVERQRRVAETVSHDPDVASVASFVGVGTVNPTVNSGRLYISLKPREERKSEVEAVIDRLREATAPLQGISLYMQAVQDVQIDSRVSRTQYQYTLQDADEEELGEWAPKLVAALSRHPELADVASDQQSKGFGLKVDVDRDRASQLNILPQDVDNTLYDAFGQRQVTIIFTQLNQYRVVLEAQPNYQLNPASLEKIFVKSTTGRMVPLNTFAKVTTQTTPLVILHEGQFPAVTLSFNLGPNSSLDAAVKAIAEAEKEINLPETVATSFSGSAAEFRSSLKSEPLLILAAIIVIYIILGVLYESYIHPITILSSLPSAGVGALLALMLFHIDLSLVSLIGIILLIGIVQKNAIMMIDFALEAERAENLTPEKSIYQAAMLRFRPIMMTTMAALLGALPLALQHGNGSELRRPLGVAIVGGLLVSQCLTLYTTPVIYLYMGRLSRWSKRLRNAAGLEEVEPVPASVKDVPATAP